MGSGRARLANILSGFCLKSNNCHLTHAASSDFGLISFCRRFSKSRPHFHKGIQSTMDASEYSTSSHVGPVKMKIESPEFHSLFTPGLLQVKQLFQQNNHQLCFAGGAVRDLLMGDTPKDIDFATTATPDEMIAMFKREDIRMINEGGVSHGTVTCRVQEENFEITTLRIDRITDGRHAVVEFTKDWHQDASRRDLTINSIFLDLQGNVIDFFNGIEDLKSRKVRFVGDASTRIKEDYLRILRYFRFFGRIANDGASFDHDAIAAIKAEGEGLLGISGPRIWMEMSKILQGNYIAKIIRQMNHCDVLQYIGFPKEVDIDSLEVIYNKTKHLNVNHMTYTSALLSTEQDVLRLEERVQFSRIERKTSLFIILYRDKIKLDNPKRLKFCQDILIDIPPHEGCHRDFLMEVLKYVGDFETMQQLQDWKIPKFPVNGKMLRDAGVPKGKTVGIIMKSLKDKWKDSDFLLSANELLEQIPKLLESVE